MRSAEYDTVRTREHIGISGNGGVLDFRLRQQDRQLAFDRREFSVVEQGLGAAQPESRGNDADATSDAPKRPP